MTSSIKDVAREAAVSVSHFPDMDSGTRYASNELSTADTALLIARMLFSQRYFDRDDPRETEIRRLGDRIYQRVDWQWMQVRDKRIAMRWDPETASPSRCASSASNWPTTG